MKVSAFYTWTNMAILNKKDDLSAKQTEPNNYVRYQNKIGLAPYRESHASIVQKHDGGLQYPNILKLGKPVVDDGGLMYFDEGNQRVVIPLYVTSSTYPHEMDSSGGEDDWLRVVREETARIVFNIVGLPVLYHFWNEEGDVVNALYTG